MKLVSVDEMRAIEREADASGWSYARMMEKAGLGLADVVQSFYGYADELVVTALVGSGNNGGDALAALAALSEAGWIAQAYLVRPRSSDDELVIHLKDAGGLLQEVGNDPDLSILDGWLRNSTVLLDAVFGTGVRLPLAAETAVLLEHVRTDPFLPPVVAVDCPSGVDCDSGDAAQECLRAEVTVCMAAVKAGLLKFPAHTLTGDLQVVDIGLPDGLTSWEQAHCEVVSEARVREILPARPINSHKGTFGSAVIAAGSINYTGAALLAAMGALRIGTGLVTLAVPAPLHAVLAGQIPEVTWTLLPHQMGSISGEAAGVLRKTLYKADALLLGPGFGQEDCSADFLRSLLYDTPGSPGKKAIGFVTASQIQDTANTTNLPPLVIDADGLKLLAKLLDWPKRLPPGTVLTPHPGEMSVLTGLHIDEIQADRIGIAQRFAREWGHVVVLKGAFTVVAAPDGRVGVIPLASSALAHAGTGDVLAGMISGLRAQGVPGYEAALAGTWLHAQAGITAAGHLGHEASVLARDVAGALAEVISWVWER